MKFSTLLGTQYRRKLLIVCYHGVVKRDRSSDWLSLPERAFREQVNFLSEEFKVVGIDDGVRALYNDQLSAPTACITFDDGYLNNRTVAFPVLEALRLPSTIYLATGLIGTDRRLWTTVLSGAFLQSVGAKVDLRRFGYAPNEILRESSIARISSDVVAQLKAMPAADRDAELKFLSARLSAGPMSADHQFMDWRDVAELAATGLVSFGAHTQNHEIVSRLADERLLAEVELSVREVKERVGREFPRAESNSFAYPNGRKQDFDSRTWAILSKLGISTAVTTSPGLNSPQVGRLELRRLVVGPNLSFSRFRIEAAGLHGPVASALEALNRLRY